MFRLTFQLDFGKRCCLASGFGVKLQFNSVQLLSRVQLFDKIPVVNQKEEKKNANFKFCEFLYSGNVM